MLRRIALAFGLFGIASACATTKMTSALNDGLPRQSYSRIMVAFPLADLALRQLAEGEVAARGGDRFVPSTEVLFPGQAYSTEQIAEALRANQIDGILLVTLSDAGSSSSYVPQSSNTTCSIWTSSQGCVSATTTTSGGYSMNKPWASFTATLYQLTGAVAWYATANTGGNAFADSEDLLRSMARKTVEQLSKDGVVR